MRVDQQSQPKESGQPVSDAAAPAETTPVDIEARPQRRRKPATTPMLIRVPPELADFIRDRAAEEHVSTGVIVMWMAKAYRAQKPPY